MREIKIKVHSNKKMSCLNGSFTCKKGENKIDVLVFDVDENLLQFNNFLILKSPKGTTYIDILNTNLQYSIGSFITNEIGNWTIQFLSSTQEDIVTEDEIDDTQTIMISDTLTFSVVDSLASNDLVIPPTSSNLDLLGEQLANIYNTLSVVIEEYPQVQDYIELQEELKKIEYMIEHIKIDTSGLVVEVDQTQVLNAIADVKNDVANINVDLSPISTKLDNLDAKVTNIPTSDYSSNLEQIQSDVTKSNNMLQSQMNMIQSGIMTTLSNINNTTSETYTLEGNISSRIGTNEAKEDGTLFNYGYWGLVRTEETKSLAQEILTQLSDANTLADNIIALLEG